jgi:2-phosphosulfolactate phosphatase
MGGERGGVPIQGYHLGNSPFEYRREVVQDRTIILNTTNGTPAITYARGARHLLVGGFVNASRIVAFIQSSGLDAALVCAGWRNRVALEDTLCAGLLLHMLWNSQAPSSISDSAHIAFSQYVQDRDRLVEALHRCNHAQRLRRMHREVDIDYCLKIDSLPVLPYYQDNRLLLYKEEMIKTQVATPA